MTTDPIIIPKSKLCSLHQSCHYFRTHGIHQHMTEHPSIHLLIVLLWRSRFIFSFDCVFEESWQQILPSCQSQNQLVGASTKASITVGSMAFTNTPWDILVCICWLLCCGGLDLFLFLLCFWINIPKSMTWEPPSKLPLLWYPWYSPTHPVTS